MTNSQKHVKKTHKTTTNDWILAVIIIAILLTILGLAGKVENAKAAYHPAPRAIHNAAMQSHPPRRGTTAKRAWIICQVWGRHRCRRIVNVAYCESTLSPWLRGAHYGAFQFDAHNVRVYHPGNTMWSQARAALALWNDRHWSPWQCTG